MTDVENRSPDLIDVFAEQEVEFRGLKAPLSTLVDLCPVPADQRDPEKMQQWTRGILEASGIDQEMQQAAIEEAQAQFSGRPGSDLSPALPTPKKKLNRTL